MDIWEQHEGEPDEAYIRFLYYLDFGPTRSLEAAYHFYIQSGEIVTKEKGIEVASKSVKKRRVPGQWYDDSVNYQWPFRANQWDIHMLQVAGKSVISDFYKLLAVMTSQTLNAMRTGKLIPLTYSQALEGLTLIGNFVSPEAVAAWSLDGGTSTEKLDAESIPENVSSIGAKRGQQRPA